MKEGMKEVDSTAIADVMCEEGKTLTQNE